MQRNTLEHISEKSRDFSLSSKDKINLSHKFRATKRSNFISIPQTDESVKQVGKGSMLVCQHSKEKMKSMPVETTPITKHVKTSIYDSKRIDTKYSDQVKQFYKGKSATIQNVMEKYNIITSDESQKIMIKKMSIKERNINQYRDQKKEKIFKKKKSIVKYQEICLNNSANKTTKEIKNKNLECKSETESESENATVKIRGDGKNSIKSTGSRKLRDYGGKRLFNSEIGRDKKEINLSFKERINHLKFVKERGSQIGLYSYTILLFYSCDYF